MADKISFVLYTRYEEQINMLNDEQAGQLMKAIFTYQKKGTAEVSDPVVAMLWSVIKQQLDIDNQKYQETCNSRKEAGKKGGRPKKTEGSCNAEEKAKKPNGFSEKQTKAKKPDNEIEYDCEIDSDSENHNKPYSGDGGGGSKTRARASEESLPVDKAPLEAGAAEAADSHPICYPPEVRAYVDALFAQYRTKRPSNADYDRAIPYACRPAYDENGESYPVLDEEKSKLLEYAFEQGTENGNTSWRYISGVYKRFAERGIETVEDANRYEWQRATGQTPKEFIDRFYGSDNLCEI